VLNLILTITPAEYHDKIEELFKTFHINMLCYASQKLEEMNCPDPIHYAEDIVQDTFFRVSLYCDSIDFDAGHAKLKAYLFAVATNEIFKYVKKNKYTLELDEEFCGSGEDDFLNDIISRERYDQIVEVVKSMDEKYSIPLFFYLVQEFPPKKIAEVLGVPEKTVYTRISRGKRILAELLEKRLKL